LILEGSGKGLQRGIDRKTAQTRQFSRARATGRNDHQIYFQVASDILKTIKVSWRLERFVIHFGQIQNHLLATKPGLG